MGNGNEPKPNSKVWRYMSFDRFVQLLSYSKLYFSRVDKLSDKLEGNITHNIITEIHNRYNRIPDLYLFPEEKQQKIEKDIKHEKKYNKYTLVNCWSQNSNESFALWKIYLGCQPYGVSIQTRYKKLKSCIVDKKFKEICRYKKVYYSAKVKEEKVSSVYFRKDKFYKFENEIRMAILYQWKKFDGAPKYSKGTLVKVDLNDLIEKVYVSPFAPEFFYDFVQYVINEKYNYSFQVIKSKLKKVYKSHITSGSS